MEADKDSSVTLNLFALGHLEQFVTSEKNTALFVKNLFLGLDLVQTNDRDCLVEQQKHKGQQKGFDNHT